MNPRLVLAALLVVAISVVSATRCTIMSTNGANAGTCYVYLYSGTTIRVSTCPSRISNAWAEGDTILTLRNPAGSALVSNDDSSPRCNYADQSAASYLSYYITTSGNYSIRATCYQSASTCAGSVVEYTTTPEPYCSIGTCTSCTSFSNSGCGWCATSSTGGSCSVRSAASLYSPAEGTCGSATSQQYAAYSGLSCSSASANAAGQQPAPASTGTNNGGGGGGGSSTVGGVTGKNAIGTGVAMGLVAPFVITGLVYIVVRCCKCACITGGDPSLHDDSDKKSPAPLSPISAGSPTPVSSTPAPPGGAMEMQKVWTPSAAGGSSSHPSTPMASAPPPPYSAEGAVNPQDIKVDMPNGQQPQMMMMTVVGPNGQPMQIQQQVVGSAPAPTPMCDNQCGSPAAVRCENCSAHYCQLCETRLHEPPALRNHNRVALPPPQQQQPPMTMPVMMMAGSGGYQPAPMGQAPAPSSMSHGQPSMMMPGAQQSANPNAPAPESQAQMVASQGIGLEGGSDSCVTYGEGQQDVGSGGPKKPISAEGGPDAAGKAANSGSAGGATGTGTGGPVTAKDVTITYKLTWKEWTLFMLGWSFVVAGLAAPQWLWTGGSYGIDLDLQIDLFGSTHGGGTKSYSCTNTIPYVDEDTFAKAGGGILAGGSLMAMASFVGMCMSYYVHRSQVTVSVNSSVANRPNEYILIAGGGLLMFIGGAIGIFTILAYDNQTKSTIDTFNATWKVLCGGSFFSSSNRGDILTPGPMFGLYTTGACLLVLLGLMVLGTNRVIQHAMSLSWTLAIIIGFVLVATLKIVYIWIAVGFAYLCYFIEVFRSHTYGYVKNIHSDETAAVFVERIRNVRPSIWMRVVCYHYETRTRVVSDGKGHTRTETYTVRVDTYSETLHWAFDSWSDESGALTGLSNSGAPATKLSMSKRWTFADQHSKSKFHADSTAFQARNRWRDVHMDYFEGMNINGFKERLLALIDITRRPCALDTCTFVSLSLLLLMTWPYRLWLDSMSVRKHFQFIKQVKCN